MGRPTTSGGGSSTPRSASSQRRATRRSRVGDVAKEAGVAYGLVYHYFGSKDAVLEAVFREAWGRLLAAVALAEETGETAPEQLELVVKIVLRAWRDDPDLVRLLVREITRSPHIQDELDEIGQAFASLERIVRRGQEEGTFRADVDAALAAWMLYGALEEVLTGLGARPAARRRGRRRRRRARGDSDDRRRAPRDCLSGWFVSRLVSRAPARKISATGVGPNHRRPGPFRCMGGSPHARPARALAAARPTSPTTPASSRSAGAADRAGAGAPRGRRRRDRRRADRRPRLGPAGHALRAARDPRRVLPARARTSRQASTRSPSCRIVDYGDAPVIPADPAATHAAIERLVGEVVDAGALPVTLGGDHSITEPCIAAIAERAGRSG